ncbi:MAG: Gfo/Idh/MocA family protein [Acidimicrobiia bacterium]
MRLRIGVLGAARIAPAAIVRPAREVPEVDVVAVAARDRSRAEKFASKHGIPRVHDDYEALIADPDVDAIYNPLPNGLHAVWTERALAAGKHVLCETPLTANAAEAERVAAAAAQTPLVVMEAFHYRYHPVAERMREIAQSGELGTLQRVETFMCIPLPLPKDIRYRYDLAGGAVMDVGCYAIHMNRLVAGSEPTVLRATARLAKPKVDRWMRAELSYSDTLTGTMTCALFSSTLLKIRVKVTGDRGSLSVFNPTGPQFGYRMTVRQGGAKRRVRVDGAKKPTYSYQLEAFAAAVLRGQPVLTPPADSVANMRVVDAVYEAAGLPVRGT